MASVFHGYEIIRKVGTGSFGVAVLVKHQKSGVRYVLKRIECSKLSKKDVDMVRQEAKLLAAVDHPFIVSYKDSFWNGPQELCLVMSYCEGGDLDSELRKSKRPSERQVVEWVGQIASALAYMHARHVLHRDIKPANVFLMENKAMLGDFGIARVLEDSLAVAMTQVGTPYYMSPELMRNLPYGSASDTWALGCLMYEMLTTRHAFEAKDIKGLMKQVTAGKYAKLAPPITAETSSLVDSMLQMVPEHRPAMEKVHTLCARHPLLAGSSSAGEGRGALLGDRKAGSPERLKASPSRNPIASPSRRPADAVTTSEQQNRSAAAVERQAKEIEKLKLGQQAAQVKAEANAAALLAGYKQDVNPHHS